ncbi:MAG TPA: hypothetical protein VMP41_15390 [Acidimicrobiales bacterium]|nr:hypothetical protein [Acidimicrobiales bacterium]
MDEQVTGPTPGEAAAPEESGLAERLIREEFGAPTAVPDETAPVPVTATTEPARDASVGPGAAIHEEFAEPDRRPSPSRNHRTGMLAGLGVVGALLAVLVLLSPGSGQPKLPVQSVHDVSPIAASGPKTAAATVLPAALPSTTSSTTAPSTTQPHQSSTAPTTVTYVYPPRTTTPAPTPAASAPAPAPTTAPPPPPPPTTTTTSPPTTTTTAKHCILGLIC